SHVLASAAGTLAAYLPGEEGEGEAELPAAGSPPAGSLLGLPGKTCGPAVPFRRLRAAGERAAAGQSRGTKSYSPNRCKTKNVVEVSAALVTWCGRRTGTVYVSP